MRSQRANSILHALDYPRKPTLLHTEASTMGLATHFVTTLPTFACRGGKPWMRQHMELFLDVVVRTRHFGVRDESAGTGHLTVARSRSLGGHRRHRPSMGGDTDLTSRHISHIFGAPFESCFVPMTLNPCRR